MRRWTRRRALGLAVASSLAGWTIGGCGLRFGELSAHQTVAAPAAPPPPQVLEVASDPGDPAAMATLQTLQGVLAQTRPRLYIRLGGVYDRWLRALTDAGIQATDAGDVWTLLRRHAHELGGAVVYSPYERDGLNLATSLAGPLRAVAVSAAQRALAETAGVRVLADVTGRSADWAFTQYWPRLRHDVLIEQAPDNPALRDYGPAVGALTYYSGNDAARARILSVLRPGSPVLGWGDASHGEDVFVGADSAAGCYNVASDHAYNVTALARRVPLRQKPGQGAPTGGQGRHTVTFVMTDGDNAQWMLNDFTTGSQWFGNPDRGKVPIGWTVPPSLGRLAPPVLGWLYGAGVSGRDVFLAGPSGLGYAYPAHMPDRHAFGAASAAAMAEADLHLAVIIDKGGFRADVLGDFLRHPQVAGVVYWEYSRYDAQQGRILWVGDKPAVAPRALLWTPGFNDPAALADRLNASPTDPTRPDGYSLVGVHAWSQGYPGVLATVTRLSAQVEVVPPDVFFARLAHYRPGRG